MPLDKAIEHGKERRKPYRGAKRFDRTCRNHGSCPWCERNRLANFRRRLEAAQRDMRDALSDDASRSNSSRAGLRSTSRTHA